MEIYVHVSRGKGYDNSVTLNRARVRVNDVYHHHFQQIFGYTYIMTARLIEKKSDSYSKPTSGPQGLG
jgi:hypothetical protein